MWQFIRLYKFFLHCFYPSILSVSCSVGLPLRLSSGILFISLHTHNTLTYTHMHKSLDTCIFDSCLRIINNFVFIYLFVCIWGWQKWEVCVCACVFVCLCVWEQKEAIILLFKCSTLKIYIVLAGYTFLSGKCMNVISVCLKQNDIVIDNLHTSFGQNQVWKQRGKWRSKMY